MKKFFNKVKSCYGPRPTTNKKKLPKSPPSSGRIQRHPLYSAAYRIQKRRRRDWEPATSDITEDSREDRRDSSVDHNEVVVTKPPKKPNVVLPSDDYKNNREWWKSMPIMVLSFAVSMS